MTKLTKFYRGFSRLSLALGLVLFNISPAGAAGADSTRAGLLFYLSGENGFQADYAAGKGAPNYLNNIEIIPGGAHGKGFHCGYRQLMSYWAPGNIYAQRGTLAFDWRSAEPFTKTEFPIFRVGFADHSSWDMVWLRIDYNGHGFDAFVTDANLARVRVSYDMPKLPAPDQWSHFALTWDENKGIRFYVNGEKVAQKDTVVVLNTGLDQFGPHSRIISPYQVQSAYNFMRGGDLDEVRIFDRALDDNDIRQLAKGEQLKNINPVKRDLANSEWRDEWNLRYGWNRDDMPPYLNNGATTVRKVGILEAYDLKRWYWKANDGIRETTWPGVYNRSRIIGRNDYFQLPDWDCYSLSGQSVRFNMPDEPWNYVEIVGGADGKVTLTADKNGNGGKPLFERSKGQERTFHKVGAPVQGETLVFTNNVQETPIGEFNTFYVREGDAPKGIARLNYTITANGNYNNPNITGVMDYIKGRYVSDEQSVMLAAPGNVPAKKHSSTVAGASKLPLVHIVIPGDFRSAGLASTFAESNMPRYLSYTWANMYAGLDGIRIELPAMDVTPVKDGLFPMNVQVKDPIWPLRNMMDFSFSVKPNEARVLWLDLRDRILPNDKPLYLTLAGGGADFNADLLEGAKIELVFKPWEEAKKEHVTDRFTQVRDNYAMIVEEGPNNRRLNKYNQFEADMTDLLRIEPNHMPGRSYWYVYNEEQPRPDYVQQPVPDGIPVWAFRQLEILKRYRQQIEWYIDNRQIENGEFGGGISDDSDLGNWFPGLALMGDMPDKLSESARRLLEAAYDQGMLPEGMSGIQTDGLHTYEEGVNTLGQVALMRIGDPKQVERLMQSARSVRDKLIGVNKAGHTHFRSDYFSATKIADEGVWAWSSPREFLHLIPAMFLGELYGNTGAREQVIGIADGLLAHSKIDERGRMTIDIEVNFQTDEGRAPGLGHAVPVLLAAWQWTGDPKYLRPIKDGGLNGITTTTANIMDMAGWRKEVASDMAGRDLTDAGDAVQHLGWQVTGDKKYLENYYEGQIAEAAAREYINTEGSLWIDRFVFGIDEIQRSRLGGVAHTRRSFFPGNVVSWKFPGTYDAEKVAVLIPDASMSSFHVELFNTDQKEMEIDMTGWEVLGGNWEMTQGIDTNGDGVADQQISKKQVKFGRNETVKLSVPSRKNVIVGMKLIGRGQDYNKRVELGIGQDDVRVDGEKVMVTVHNLGGVASKPTVVALVDAGGKVVSQATVPALKAPLDLLPKTADVVLAVPAGMNAKGCSVQIDPQGKLTEITKANNKIEIR